MTISPSNYAAYSYPMPAANYNTAIQNPIQNTNAGQIQPAANIGPNTKGEPDLVCNAQYDAKTKALQLSSFERGWIDSNLWHTINPDGSGMTQSAWGIVSKYPQGTFSNVYNKAQETYYTQGKISDDTALELTKEVRLAADIARQNGTEMVEKQKF